MKVTMIPRILDTALRVRKGGGSINYCFVGESGIGKTEMVEQWSEANELPCQTLIVSQLESTDFVGRLITYKDEETGRDISDYAPPKFFVKLGQKAVLFLDEIDKAKDDVKAALLQLLHKRRLHDCKLSDGIILVAAVNPDSEFYMGGTLSTEMKTSRLRLVNVEYDHQGFVEYAEKAGYHPMVVEFLKSGAWTYYSTDKIGNDAGARYLCPRDWKATSDERMYDEDFMTDLVYHRQMSCEGLGSSVGEMFHKFCFEESPVLAADLLKDKAKAFKKLKKMSAVSKKEEAGGGTMMIAGSPLAHTVSSIAENYCGTKTEPGKVGFVLMLEVAKIINANAAVQLIKACFISSGNDMGIDEFMEAVKSTDPELQEALQTNLDIERKAKVKKEA